MWEWLPARLYLALLLALGWLPVLAQEPAQGPSTPTGQFLERGQALYARGQYAAALPLLTRAARSGNAEAQAMLGAIYENGTGVRTDERISVHWYQLAADQGHREALYRLGAMHENGTRGLPRDDRTAIEYYIRSAQHGFAPAALILGVDYELGDGIPRSRATALHFLQQAGSEGRFITSALQAPGAPSRFDSVVALRGYLAQFPDSPLTASRPMTTPNQQAAAPMTLRDILNWKCRTRRTDLSRLGTAPASNDCP